MPLISSTIMLKLLFPNNAGMVFDLDCNQINILINSSLLNSTPSALNASTLDHSNCLTDSVFSNNSTSGNVDNFIFAVIFTILILSCFINYSQIYFGRLFES